eukprot:RCo042751
MKARVYRMEMEIQIVELFSLRERIVLHSSLCTRHPLSISLSLPLLLLRLWPPLLLLSSLLLLKPLPLLFFQQLLLGLLLALPPLLQLALPPLGLLSSLPLTLLQLPLPLRQVGHPPRLELLLRLGLLMQPLQPFIFDLLQFCGVEEVVHVAVDEVRGEFAVDVARGGGGIQPQHVLDQVLPFFAVHLEVLRRNMQRGVGIEVLGNGVDVAAHGDEVLDSPRKASAGGVVDGSQTFVVHRVDVGLVLHEKLHHIQAVHLCREMQHALQLVVRGVHRAPGGDDRGGHPDHPVERTAVQGGVAIGVFRVDVHAALLQQQVKAVDAAAARRGVQRCATDVVVLIRSSTALQEVLHTTWKVLFYCNVQRGLAQVVLDVQVGLKALHTEPHHS